ncbi:MAG: carboxypeptidase-like regulatory protein [Mucilaginibacter sp.]|nr:carboxypeptidase-like regulatory protein [Mucilaginibacter sp.]
MKNFTRANYTGHRSLTIPHIYFPVPTGHQGLFGREYNYENITANITKRFSLSRLGYADVSTEGGYILGKVPFPLLDIHHANQTYALQRQSYNLMNFLEFVSDHYAAINIDQSFNGFLFNKVPVLKKLK